MCRFMICWLGTFNYTSAILGKSYFFSSSEFSLHLTTKIYFSFRRRSTFGLLSNLLCYWICLFLRPGVTWKQFNFETNCWVPFHRPLPWSLHGAQPENSVHHSLYLNKVKFSVIMTPSTAHSTFSHFSTFNFLWFVFALRGQWLPYKDLSVHCSLLHANLCRPVYAIITEEGVVMDSCQEGKKTSINPLRRNLANKCVDFQIMPSFSSVLC